MGHNHPLPGREPRVTAVGALAFLPVPGAADHPLGTRHVGDKLQRCARYTVLRYDST